MSYGHKQTNVGHFTWASRTKLKKNWSGR